MAPGRPCVVLLQVALALSLNGVAPQPNATNHTPARPPANQPGDTALEQWARDPLHQLMITGSAAALIVLVACILMHLKDRRRRGDDDDDDDDDDDGPSEPLWRSQRSPYGSE